MVTILFFLLFSSFASIIGRDFKSAFISILKRLFCYCWSVSLKWLDVLLHSLLSTISIKLLRGKGKKKWEKIKSVVLFLLDPFHKRNAVI